MPKNLLTTRQVAEYLKIDKFTVYRLVTQRKVPAAHGALVKNSSKSGRDNQ